MTEGQTPQTAQALDQGSLHHKTATPGFAKKSWSYPAVLPKYRNPAQPFEISFGRGK
jgi:hypothetical protein